MQPIRLAALVLAMWSAAAGAQTLYRWTDERGGVNYGDTPPRGAKDVRPVKSNQVTVVPAVPREQIDAARRRDDDRRREQAARDAADARAREAAEQAAFTRPPIEVSEAPWVEDLYWPTWPPHLRPPPVTRPPLPRPPVRPTPAPPALGQPPLPLGQPPILPR
jgi:hypothetical protein